MEGLTNQQTKIILQQDRINGKTSPVMLGRSSCTNYINIGHKISDRQNDRPTDQRSDFQNLTNVKVNNSWRWFLNVPRNVCNNAKETKCLVFLINVCLTCWSAFFSNLSFHFSMAKSMLSGIRPSPRQWLTTVRARIAQCPFHRVSYVSFSVRKTRRPTKAETKI